jgi:hypothetical protein
MNHEYYNYHLKKAGVIFAPGLSPDEIQSIEQEYHFQFPPDLKEFLMFALPISEGFLNWRQANREQVSGILSWPYKGICFDIEHNAFWLEEWGPCPASLDSAFEVVRNLMNDAPTLIPIYGHRYIPDEPNEDGNPVFSVYQTDVIYYGGHLGDYFKNEFSHSFGRKTFHLDGKIKPIKFWSGLVG